MPGTLRAWDTPLQPLSFLPGPVTVGGPREGQPEPLLHCSALSLAVTKAFPLEFGAQRRSNTEVGMTAPACAERVLFQEAS